MVLNQKSGCYTKTQSLMQTVKNLFAHIQISPPNPPKTKEL